MKRTIASAISVLVLSGVMGCREAPPKTPDPQRLPFAGSVVRVTPETRLVEVAHEAIGTLMPAMTMPFEVRGDMHGVQVGDQVKATAVVGTAGIWLEDFAIVKRAAEGTGAPKESSGSTGPATPERRTP